MTRWRSLFIVAVFFGFVVGYGLMVRADSATDLQNQIDISNSQIAQLKDEIAKLQNDLNATSKQKQTLQTAVTQLNLNIQKLQKSIALTQAQISQKDREIDNLSGSIATTAGAITTTRGQVADSLRQLQAVDSQPLVVTFLGGGTLSDFFDQAAGLTTLRTELQNKIVGLSSLRSNLETNKNTAEGKRKELGTLNNNLGQQKQGLTLAKTQQTSLLEQTKNKESAYQALIAQKQAEERAFEEALIKLAAGLGPADTGSAPSPAHGILNWPLGNVAVTQPFGNTAFAKSGAYSGQGHNGIDFRASIGTPVKSVLSGTIQEVNQGAVKYCQYGKWVLVRHDNGLSSLYAHLSNIAVTKGQRVATGDLVGYSGDTGYATGPHLHLTVYVASAVMFKQYTCNSGSTAYIPIAPLNAYLNPLSYLPSL